MRLVQGVEMKAWDAEFEQRFALPCCILNPKGCDRRVVVTELIEPRNEGRREFGPAKRNKFLCLSAGKNGQHPRNNRNFDAELSHEVIVELIKIFIVEKEL